MNKPGQDSSKNTMAPTDPPKVKPTDDLSKETCKLQSSKSCQEQKISACLGYSLTGMAFFFSLFLLYVFVCCTGGFKSVIQAYGFCGAFDMVIY